MNEFIVLLNHLSHFNNTGYFGWSVTNRRGGTNKVPQEEKVGNYEKLFSNMSLRKAS